MENEIKFKISNPKKLCSLLVSLGARKYPKLKEEDYSFDSQDGSLSRQGKLLRLRKIGNKALLTFKGPLMKAQFKKREEINIELNDFNVAKQLLYEIGFMGKFVKEKIRQKFAYEGLDISLDKVPFIGYYIEIEGKDRKILEFIKKIGLNRKDAIRESYEQLFSLFSIVNQNKIKHLSGKLECNFKCAKRFNRLKNG
jgi:adenylate cyclase class 2